MTFVLGGGVDGVSTGRASRIRLVNLQLIDAKSYDTIFAVTLTGGGVCG